MEQTFSTPTPISLHVEIQSGSVRVEAVETAETHVHVDGRDADEVTVEQRGDEVVVLAPTRMGGFFGGGSSLRVTVSLPQGSNLAVRTGSADVVARGRYGAVRIKSGSGGVRLDELTGPSTIDTGSGDIEVDRSRDELRVKTGSGEVEVGLATATLVVATGSGDISIGTAEAGTALKTGSGDIVVHDARTDVSAMTGSGDVQVGRITRGVVKAKAASGTIHVGVPAGIPVWTDVSCVTGSVRSNLQGAGQPEEGQDHIEIRATTVSGDVTLAQL